jgi:hypothetical protein
VSKFIEECRREWKRLRVPDPVANEMAADLAADLQEAEAEGASAEEVLGSSAFDPRSFAASWAAERGVIRPAPSRDRLPRRPPRLAAIAAVIITVIGAVLVIAPRPGSPRSMSIVLPRHEPAPSVPHAVHATASVIDVYAIGWILLIAGIVGIALAILFWWVSAGSGHSRRRAYIDEAPSGYY